MASRNPRPGGRSIALAGLVLLALTSGCSRCHRPRTRRPPVTAVTVTVPGPQGKTKVLRLTLRATYGERAAPIGRLRSGGLLYVYPRARPLGVDHHTATVPVDVVLLDDQRQVLRVATVQPATKARVSVAPTLHRYIIVLPANTAHAAGLVPRARVGFTLPARAQAQRLLTPVALSPPGRSRVQVMAELALTEPERTMGLMWRTQLPSRGGMLFRFPRSQILSFWMKNTLISLDMIFFNGDFVVTGVVHRAKPKSLSAAHVGPVESRYVLEVPAGFARRYGIARGTSVSVRLSD